MPRLSFVEDSDSSESDDDATAANEADSSSHATGAAASLSQPEDARQANTAPAPSGGSAAQLRQRATERWEHLRTLTKDERLKCALSPAAAEAAAEAEGLCPGGARAVSEAATRPTLLLFIFAILCVRY